MKFDVYGRFQIEVRREADQWIAYQVVMGKTSLLRSIAIPAEIQSAEEMAQYLDDIFHEAAGPGQTVRILF